MKISYLHRKKATFTALLILLLSVAGMTKTVAQTQNDRGQKPSVTAMSATNITSTSATLRAKINPNGSVGAYVFEYGLTTSYGTTVGGGTLEAGSSYVTVTYNLTGLDPDETYHFRVRAGNNYGLTLGDDRSFTTLSEGGAPTATTLAAIGVTENQATMKGRIDPNGYNTAWRFEYGTTTSYGEETPASWVYASEGVRTVASTLVNLPPNTTYHYRVIAASTQGYDYGSDMTFTTLQGNAPNPPSNPTPSDYATGVSVNPTLSWSCSSSGSNISYYEVYVRTPDYNFNESYTTNQTSYTLPVTLEYNQEYYWRVVAINTEGVSTQGPLWHFTTIEGGNPIVQTGVANMITATSAVLNGSVNPQGLQTTYYFQYGTTTNYGSSTVQGVLPGSNDVQTISASLSGLQPNTTYHYRLYASNSSGTQYGADQTFTTSNENCFYDCTSSSCGQYGQQMYTAAQYLCEHGIVEGINGYLNPDVNLTRAQLAKVALFGLYNGENNVPNPLVTDYFPSIYPDLQDNTTYYYRAAKALLYLEYGDGISPFDRDRSCFNPTGNIERCFVLKVLLETFNIAPLSSGTNVFDDFGPSGYTSSNFWGYAQKAYNLNIVQTTHFRPNDYCTRGEAFLYLYRILTNDNITKPTPVNSESPATSSFFIPANLSPEVVNSMRGVEYGNFNYYEKDFFEIPGYMDLGFGIAYNSYLTEMPDDFYPVKPLGKAWTHTYDMYMNIVTDAYNNSSIYVFHMKDGALLMYTNVNGTMTSLTEGNYYELTTSGSNKYILKSTEQVSYTFERQSTSDGIYYLTQIKDRNNNALNISYSYGNSHYRITSVSTLGRTLNFYYSSGTDLLSSVKDPINRQVYFYFTNGELSSLKDAKNQTTSFSYGTLDMEKGLLKEITLPRGNKVYNNYQQRKLTSMKYNNNAPTTVSIVPSYQNGNTTSTVTQPVQGSQSITTQYTMNADSRITRIQDSNNKDISFAYNNSSHASLVSQMTDNKANLQTSFSYNSKGQMTSSTISGGRQTISMTYTYNSNNDITSFTDANNNTTHYYYTNGNLTSIVDALGNTATYTNNSHGSPTQVTNPMGVTTTYEYNDYGNVTNIAIPAMNLSGSITYDGVSRIVSKTDMGGNLTSYTYDANDNVLTETDALNHVTTYEFDANDNVTQITNAKGYSTLMTYDNNDFLTAVTFQNATKNYAYNTDGTLKTYTDPNGNVFNYTYNNSGNLLGDGYATYSYNNKGQLVSVTKDNKAIEYVYDALSRVTSVSYDGKTVSYAYDNNGNVTSITYPGNKTVTYTYDALNHMTSVKDWNNATTTYSYRNDGQISYYQYPNNVRTTLGYDNAGRCNSQITRRNSGSGTTIANYGFTLNSVGSHTQESVSEPYASYPAMPSVNLSYSYNNANRLLSAGDLSFGYDSNGNTTSRTGRNYTYDTKNNLTGVSGDFSASYSYDGYGNRRSATRNGETKKYVLDLLTGNGNVLMETDNSGNVLYYYVYGASGIVSRISASNETRYYVYDYRGSTVAMTDASTSANITHKYQYDDFGKVLQSEESDANPFQYIGQHGVMYETEGLSFMRARYYDESIGRFLSEDPIWSVNLYPYADNNPICNTDPTGKVTESIETLLWVGKDVYNPVPNIAAAAKARAMGDAAKKVAVKEAEVMMDKYLATEGTKAAVTAGAKTAGSKAAVGIGGSIGTTVAVGVAGAAIATGSCIWAHKLGSKGKKGAAYGVGVGGGALGGAMLGAAIGSVIPGVGTAVGAVIGGVIGGIAGYISARSGVNKYKKAEAERNRYIL